ncbi:Retrovirus-related Pol polyprotein from transposon 17.6, partial [Mucuna pruriens]
MVEEDKEKTTFITTWRTFFYKVMPFGLKKPRATYQRAIVTLFHDMMHKEVDVENMIANLKMPDQHLEDLRKLFQRLQKYRLRLNPAKCTFGVKTEKLLGFIVNQRGIELDVDKVKAIRNMPPPQTETEVRGFLGRVNYIARFISQLTNTRSPIFKLLQKNQKMEWNKECQEAFEKVKHYLETPPVLIPAAPGKPLILYLIVLEESMGDLRATECLWEKVFNMVEYEACAMGIIMAIEHQVKQLKVFGDSALVIYQLRREWETRDPLSLSKM